MPRLDDVDHERGGWHREPLYGSGSRYTAGSSSLGQAFICPFYWQKPMPAPPGALSDLHFAYFDLGMS